MIYSKKEIKKIIKCFKSAFIASKILRDILISDEVFYNKELCDAIRYLVIKSAIDYNNALEILNESKDYKRDVLVIKELINIGVSKEIIKRIINQINNPI